MPPRTPGAALRDVQRAKQLLKRARADLKALRAARRDADAPPAPELVRAVLARGWEARARALAVLADVPLDAADDAVMTNLLNAERYAVALLVRLRRLARGDLSAIDADADQDQDQDLDLDQDPDLDSPSASGPRAVPED